MQTTLENVKSAIESNLLGITLWVVALILIQVWRRGYPQEAVNRLQDSLRSDHPAGYTQKRDTRKSLRSSALMGSSTENFALHDLTIRDITLIKFAVYAMSNFNRQTHMVIESQLRLPHEKRKAAHSLISTQLDRRQESPAAIARPFLRDMAGNLDIPQKILSDLCIIAINTGNSDSATHSKIMHVAHQLGLPQNLVDRHFKRF